MEGMEGTKADSHVFQADIAEAISRSGIDLETNTPNYELAAEVAVFINAIIKAKQRKKKDRDLVISKLKHKNKDLEKECDDGKSRCAIFQKVLGSRENLIEQIYEVLKETIDPFPDSSKELTDISIEKIKDMKIVINQQKNRIFELNKLEDKIEGLEKECRDEKTFWQLHILIGDYLMVAGDDNKTTFDDEEELHNLVIETRKYYPTNKMYVNKYKNGELSTRCVGTKNQYIGK